MLWPFRRRSTKAIVASEWGFATSLPCRFAEAWAYALPGLPIRRGADPYAHDPPNVMLELRPLGSALAQQFPLCADHRAEFVRFEMRTGRSVQVKLSGRPS